MKRIFLLLILLLSIYANSQTHLMYKCKNNTQRDSISTDLKSKGYVGYECEVYGIFINLQSDDTFCFSNTLLGYREVTLTELYSNVKVVSTYAEVKSEIKEDLCSNVEVKTDKFNGEVSYNSPDVDDISFIKYKKKGIVNQYISISVYNTYLSGVNDKGLIILFKSGKKIIRSNEKVDVNTSTGSNWRYSVFFTPTLNEINLFKNDEIIGVKLYIFDSEISQGDRIKEYAKCVLVTPKKQVKKK